MHALAATILASVFSAGAVSVIWVIGIVLIVAGAIALFRSSLILGVILIVVGVLLGGSTSSERGGHGRRWSAV
jgi:hypothetical protein